MQIHVKQLTEPIRNKRLVVTNSLGLIVASLEEGEETSDIKGCGSQTVRTANGRKWVQICLLTAAQKQQIFYALTFTIYSAVKKYFFLIFDFLHICHT